MSGGTALLYEVAWLRLLVLVFGTTSFAVATVLSVFMAGLALGGYLFGRLVDRCRRPVLLYALLELGIGGYALLTPNLFEDLVPLYGRAGAAVGPSSFGFGSVRFGLAFAALLLPTTLMGGTLPVLSRFFVRRSEETGFRVGTLYAVNTIGAAAGSVATGFLLLPSLGLSRTIAVGVAINALVGAAALLVVTRLGEGHRIAAPARAMVPLAQGSAGADRRAALVLLIFALSGLLAMAYEAAWTRLLTLVLGSSTYAFTVMVTTFILGISLGSAIMARPADRVASPVGAFGALQLSIGVTTFLGLLLAHRLPSAFLWLFHWTHGHTALFVAGQVWLAGLVMLAPALCLGAVFPVVTRFLGPDPSIIGGAVGKAYAANTAGAVLGALAGGFLFVSLLGIQGTILLGVFLNLAAGATVVGLAPGLGSRPRVRWLAVAAAGAALVVIEAPAWDRLVMSSGVYREAPKLLSLYRSPKEALDLLRNFDLLYYREGPTATVTVVERPVLEDRRQLALAIDGKVDASTAQDMATQILSAHLPLMLARRLDRVLVVGWGSGVTVGSALLYPVRSLTALEIEPAVIEASRAFDDVNGRPLEDRRLRLVLDDGRNYLLVAPDTFDLIISEPSNPWMSGPAKLFTLEFFQLGAAHLTRDGIFCQWLQLYGLEPAHLRALVRTFQRVFPHAYLVQTAEADLALLGSRDPFTLDVRSLRVRFREPAIARDLARVGVEGPGDLLARFLLGPPELASLAGDGPLNTDDNGLIEFAAPKALYRQTIETNVRTLNAAGQSVARYLDGFRDARDEADLLVDVAEGALAQGRPETALHALHRAVELAPSAKGYWLLGEAMSRAGDGAGALRSWERALGLDPRHLASLLSRARRFIAERRWSDALRELVGATAADPENTTAWTLSALVHHARGHYRAAQAALEHAGAGGAPGQFETIFRRYLAYRLATAGVASRRGVGAALEAFVQSVRDWRQGVHWATSPPHTGAVDSLEALVQLFFPDDQELRDLLEADVVRPLTAFYTGLNAYLLGSYRAAIETLTPLEAEAAGSLPLASYYLGLAHFRAGHAEAAAGAWVRFLEAAPPERRQGATYADAKVRLSAALRGMGLAEDGKRSS